MINTSSIREIETRTQISISAGRLYSHMRGFLILIVGLLIAVFACYEPQYSEYTLSAGIVIVGAGLTVIMAENEVENEFVRKLWIVVTAIIGVILGKLVFP